MLLVFIKIIEKQRLHSDVYVIMHVHVQTKFNAIILTVFVQISRNPRFNNDTLMLKTTWYRI